MAEPIRTSDLNPLHKLDCEKRVKERLISYSNPRCFWNSAKQEASQATLKAEVAIVHGFEFGIYPCLIALYHAKRAQVLRDGRHESTSDRGRC